MIRNRKVEYPAPRNPRPPFAWAESSLFVGGMFVVAMVLYFLKVSP